MFIVVKQNRTGRLVEHNFISLYPRIKNKCNITNNINFTPHSGVVDLKHPDTGFDARQQKLGTVALIFQLLNPRELLLPLD